MCVYVSLSKYIALYLLVKNSNYIYTNLINIFTQPLHTGVRETRSILKRSWKGCNIEFSFSTSNHTKAIEPSLP